MKKEVLAILVGGKNICQVTALTVRDAIEFFNALKLTERQQIIAKQVLKEILARLKFLNDVGLVRFQAVRHSVFVWQHRLVLVW